LEYAEAGVRVNAICPGTTRTPMIEQLTQRNPQAETQMIARIPLGRMATPEEIAEAVVWLCSDAATFITGHTLVADGGVIAS
jgi:NAD(P)-dependent dehydrogenase (short-subunit alcohol dehydrogenase family)